MLYFLPEVFERQFLILKKSFLISKHKKKFGYFQKVEYKPRMVLTFHCLNKLFWWSQNFLQILGLFSVISKVFLDVSLEHFFLTVGQNNFGNKIPLLLFLPEIVTYLLRLWGKEFNGKLHQTLMDHSLLSTVYSC